MTCGSQLVIKITDLNFSGVDQITSISGGGLISCKNIDVEGDLSLGTGINKKTITSLLDSK